MKRLEWYIARRYLASRRKGQFLSLITLISIGGIALGVMALITVIAVMTGLQRDLQEKILGTSPHIYVFDVGEGLRVGPEWPQLVDSIRRIKGVVAAEPFVMTQVGVTRGTGYAKPGTLYGVDTTSLATPLTELQRKLQQGDLSFDTEREDRAGVILGRRLADNLGLLPGDQLNVLSLEKMQYGALGEIYPRIRIFEVSGIYESGMYEYDATNLYAPLGAVQEMLAMGDSVGGIAVNVVEPWEASAIGDRIDRALGDGRFSIQDWQMLNRSLFSALKLEKLAMTIILFLIVVVAAFNIIGTLIMVVTDKTREIGILKSMGMTDSRVLWIFMLQGLTIGIIGTVLGAIGGFVLVWLLARYKFVELPGDVYFIDTLPVAIDPLDVGAILVLSIVIAFAATIYPARQASRLQPVEAIRHD